MKGLMCFDPERTKVSRHRSQYNLSNVGDVVSMTQEVKNEVWVIAECSENRVREVTYEVIAFAKRVAHDLGVEISVVALGDSVNTFAHEIASASGCNVWGIHVPGVRFYNAEIHRALLKEFFKKRSPRFIFVPHTCTGWDFVPALAVDLSASCLTGVCDVKKSGTHVFTRQTCNGKILEDLKPLEGRPALVTVVPGAQGFKARVQEDAGRVRICRMKPGPAHTETLRYVEAPPRSVNLKDADVIVAAGRGLGSEEPLDRIRELADLFHNGAVAASRPLCDAGWLPLEHQVGMTGQTVSPKLYLAFGISGALQHTMGMNHSGLIVSVNKDPKALFCGIAHYCIVADVKAFLPILIEKFHNFLDG